MQVAAWVYISRVSIPAELIIPPTQRGRVSVSQFPASQRNFACPTTSCHSRPGLFCHALPVFPGDWFTTRQPAPRNDAPVSDCSV